MPVVEQSNIHLEYPVGDGRSFWTNGKIMLRARVNPFHAYNQVWFAYQIDEGQWLRCQASREDASQRKELYSLAIDVSTAQAGLRYLVYVVRRTGTGITVPSGADIRSPDEDEGLKKLTVNVSLTHDNVASGNAPSDDESSKDLEIGFGNETAKAEPRMIPSINEEPPAASPTSALVEEPLVLELKMSSVSDTSVSSSEDQPIPDTRTTSVMPATIPTPLSPVTSAGSNHPHIEGHIFLDHGMPASGVNLRVYNRSFDGTETKLGEVTTDNNGSYTLAYDIGGNESNLEVRAVDAQGNEIPLGETNFGTNPYVVLNLTAPAEWQPYASGDIPCAQELTPEDNAIWTIKGRLQSQNSDLKILAGCRVEVFFEERSPLEIEGSPVIKTRVSVHPDDLGIFTVPLPSKAKIAGKILRFIVSAPSGETLADKCFDIETIGDFVIIPITKVALIPRPDIVPLAETRRIKGRVIERNCRPLPSCLQVLLFAQKSGQNGTENGTSHSPIFVTRVDSSGYFFGDVPNQIYESAFAEIAGIEDQFHIALEDGYVPTRVLLVIDLTENGLTLATNNSCGCEGSIVPRTPTFSDIEESPDTYSADLGAGGCIQFNTPNRAIEEFDFYSVVRTTEPDIRALGSDNRPSDSNNVIAVLEAEATRTETAATEAEAKAAEAETAAIVAEDGVAEARIDLHNSDDPRLKKAAENIIKRAEEARAAADNAMKVAKEARSKAETARMKLAVAKTKALTEATKPLGRANLDVRNPVDWDSTPTFYEATTIALGHLLHFKQVWYADGYSLGDLLYSLPLAPGQKKLISVLDWERRESGQRTEDTFSSEELNARLGRDRDLGEVVRGTLSESTRGGSRSTSAGVGIGTGAAGNGSYQQFNFGALIGVSGGYGESNSSAWQDSSRSLSSNSLQTLRDNTLQSASAIRSLRSSVVQTVSQGEAVRATTEVIANHNHCHALTIQYFEVLRHLKVTHELADVQECLFVPLPMTNFDRAKVLRWRQNLQTYLQRPELGGAFDAARRVETNWSEVDYPTNRYADENILSISGELQLTLFIPLPPFPERPKPRPEDTLEETAKAIEQATHPTTGFLGTLLAVATGGASLVASATTNAIIDTTKAVTSGAFALAEDLFAQPSAQEKYDKFHHEIMPGIVEGFVNQLELYALVNGTEVQIPKADFTLVSEYRPGTPMLVSVRSTVNNALPRGSVSQLIIKSAHGLPTSCRAIINSATIRYRTSRFEHLLIDDRRINDDIDMPKVTTTFTNLFELSINTIMSGNGAALFTPVDYWEQRNPKLEDSRLVTELIEHMNANLEYYHHAIWWTMDPNRRYMLLDGYHAPGANGRSVASVIENRLIGIIGNSLVMPVARGNQLDSRFPKGQNANLLDFYALASPVPAARVSLPTRGVFAEAVMGSCNACEQIDDSRFWRWEESPIDQPPSIEPLSTGTRRSEPTGIQPTPFPTPIVSIQNAPSAPDPAGVRPVLDALGRESFRDMAGLAGTQANAAAAYQQALDTAYKFGKEASTLAQQAAMLKASDKTMSAIDNAEADGKITADEAKELRMSALKKMVGEKSADDKASSEADVDQKKATTETIRNIPAGSVESVETKDSTGASTSIKAKPEEGTSFDYNVTGAVPIISQPSSMTCWATVATMMVSWRDRSSYDIQDVMDMAGQTYRSKFDNDQGLSGSEKVAFLTSLGLIGEPPMSYTVRGLKTLLEIYGPLWVTSDEQPGAGFSIHARIVTGMFGDGTVDGTSLRINDPAGGQQYTETFRIFMQKFEEVPGTGALRVQVVHFPAGVEGSSSPDGGVVAKATLTLGQKVPDKNEVDAVGAIAAKIVRGTPEFATLVKNENSDIVFKDEEGTGADQMMSNRLKDKMDTLATLVKGEWPGKKLRVTEAWDETNEHSATSIHYEGRAADVTVSDQDQGKLGRLGQLAVDAGFDWVWYEDKFHIHVSVSK